MPLIYVTGMSGSGKSSVRRELLRRGHLAHDTDEDDLSSWRRATTGEPVARPDAATDRTREWYAEHEWSLPRRKVEGLVAGAGERSVFLCGSPTNGDELADLYDVVVCLTLDADTLRHRLAGRTGEEFGSAPDELRLVLGWHASFEERYRRWGALMVDATRPLAEVVDEIVERTGAG
ncbi:AAA family ATPase [Pseudonocardia lacus]|uniref:AAA family ATPase n=1 Tax=Pseudonocardia lacus TaxID=2835865 RepID=UPI001BDBE31F|nr:hypothetical protein [Pseudonocardia lacus]